LCFYYPGPKTTTTGFTLSQSHRRQVAFCGRGDITWLLLIANPVSVT
jgi:hypothetical protein